MCKKSDCMGLVDEKPVLVPTIPTMLRFDGCDEWTREPWPPLPRHSFEPGPSVIILGLGTTSGMWKVFLGDNPDAEIWTLNKGWCKEAGDAWTKHFEIHDDTVRTWFYPIPEGREIITNKDYPFKEVARELFGSSICYMLAYAHLKGYREIWMPGVDFGGERNIFDEIVSVHYWMGRLEEAGARIWYSPLSLLMKNREYGQKKEVHDQYRAHRQ
jgi:hypothetical protein